MLRGDESRIFRFSRIAPIKVPSVTVKESGERDDPFPGGVASWSVPHAIVWESMPSVQIDVWVSWGDSAPPNLPEDADAIAQKIKEILLNPTDYVAETHGWERVGGGLVPEEATQIWHYSLHFVFRYHREGGPQVEIEAEALVGEVYDGGSP
jgi:hypothetical protein